MKPICSALAVCFLLANSQALLKGASKGRMEGILAAKAKTWIEVLDDGNYLHRMIPAWQGKGPARGGGFVPETLELFDALVVGNRIRVDWSHDEHLRALNARVIEPGSSGGVFEGYLLKVGDRWMDVANVDERTPWRFYLPWVGGLPEEGGGYDRRILEQLKKRLPTDPIRFVWEYRSRPTIVSLNRVNEDKFVPFWVGKRLFEPKAFRSVGKAKEGNASLPSAPKNPFEDAAPKNPFEDAAPKNPFEDAAPQNPFEDAAPKNSFEDAAPPNPFEDAAPKNPFEDAALP